MEGKADSFRDLLAEWTNDEIRAALDASLTQPDCVLPSGAAAGSPARLLAEWMRRDFDAALAWFEGLDSATAKERLSLVIGRQWPADRAAEGLAFMKANRNLYRGGRGWHFLEKNLEQATASGPQVVAVLLLQYHKEQLHDGRTGPLEFPADFDFSLLLATDEWQELGDDPLAATVLHAWQSREPDLAFDWLLGQQGAKSLVMLANNYLIPGNTSAKWLAEKIEDLRPEDQREFLDAAKGEWIKMPQRLVAFSRGLRDPLLVEEIGASATQAMFRDVEGSLPALEAIPGVERRVELLEQAEPDESLVRTTAFREFDAYDEALLRKKLAEWKVEEPRIEAIISRYRP